MKFYALAVDQEGETRVIVNLFEGSRVEAKNDALNYCGKKGWNLKNLIPVKGTERQNNPLTKMTQEKRNRKFWGF